MQYITTTELRTNAKELIEQLKNGKTVKLLHRSRVIGSIKPEEEMTKQNKPNAKEFMMAMEDLARETPHNTDEELAKNYREHMEKKYGKYLS